MLASAGCQTLMASVRCQALTAGAAGQRINQPTIASSCLSPDPDTGLPGHTATLS